MTEQTEKYWTKEQVYDDQIAPLMKQIIGICKEHSIPLIASFNYEVDEERGVGMCTTYVGFEREPKQFKEAIVELRRTSDITSAVITVRQS